MQATIIQRGILRLEGRLNNPWLTLLFFDPGWTWASVRRKPRSRNDLPGRSLKNWRVKRKDLLRQKEPKEICFF